MPPYKPNPILASKKSSSRKKTKENNVAATAIDKMQVTNVFFNFSVKFCGCHKMTVNTKIYDIIRNSKKFKH